jgi:hypothetical protein
MTTHNLAYLPDAESAVRITPNGQHSGMDITLQNVNSTATIYIGGEGVYSGNYGYKIDPGSAFSVELSGFDAIYAASSESGSYLATLMFSLED